MWMSSEDARSDFILAAAGMIVGTLALQFLVALPFYPGGIVGALLAPFWVLLLTLGVARFFVNYRDQGLPGYGLTVERTGLQEGLVIAVPLLVAGYLRGLPGNGPIGALFGRVQPIVQGSTAERPDVLELGLRGALVAAGAIGAIAMYGMLVTRARTGFRETDVPVVEALRTFGLGAVAVSTLLGLLLSIATGSPLDRLVDGIALAATVLLADRVVARTDRTTRATMLAPAITAVVASIVATGGFLGGNLAAGLQRGTTAAAVAIVVAALIETRRVTWAVVPLVAVVMWSPTCSVLPVGGQLVQSCI